MLWFIQGLCWNANGVGHGPPIPCQGCTCTGGLNFLDKKFMFCFLWAYIHFCLVQLPSKMQTGASSCTNLHPSKLHLSKLFQLWQYRTKFWLFSLAVSDLCWYWGFALVTVALAYVVFLTCWEWEEGETLSAELAGFDLLNQLFLVSFSQSG